MRSATVDSNNTTLLPTATRGRWLGHYAWPSATARSCNVQGPREVDGVKQRLVGALTLERRHRVSCIAQQCHPRRVTQATGTITPTPKQLVL